MAREYKSGIDLIEEIRGGSTTPSIYKDSLADSPTANILDGGATEEFQEIEGQVGQTETQVIPTVEAPVVTPTSAVTDVIPRGSFENTAEAAPLVTMSIEEEPLLTVDEDDDDDAIREQEISDSILRAKEKVKQARSVAPVDGYERFSYSDINKYTGEPMAAARRKLAMEDDPDLAAEGITEKPYHETGLKNPNNFADSIFERLKSAAIEGSKPLPKTVEGTDPTAGPLQESTMQHKIKLAGETVYMTTAETGGFLLNIAPWLIEDPYNFVLEAFDLPVGRMSTVDYGKYAEDFLFKAYEAAGIEPQREELLSTADAMIYSAATVMSIGGVVGGVVRATTKGTALASSKILKTEATIGAVAATSSAITDTIYIDEEDSPAKRKTVADYTAMVSSVAPIFYTVGRGLIRKPDVSSVKKDYEDHLTARHTEASESGHITSDMRDLINEGDATHQLRMLEIYKKIKEFDKDFNPNIASAIGSQRAGQRATELSNASPKEMMEIYNKNTEIINKYVDRKRNPATASEDQTSLVELILTKQKSEVDYRNWLQDEHDTLMTTQREAAMGHLPKGLIQDNIQKALIDLKDSSSELADTLFKAVDPDNKVRIAESALKDLGTTHAKILTRRTAARDTDDTMNFLNNTWAQLVENQLGTKFVAWRKEQLAQIKAGAEQGLTVKAKPYEGYDATDPETWDFITYKGARNLQKQAYDLFATKDRNLQKSDLNYEELSPLVESVTNQIAKSALKTNDEGISSRLDKAVSYWRDEHVPRYKDNGSIGTDFTRTTGKGDNRRAVLDYDKLFNRIWAPDGGTTELREFNKTINGSENKLEQQKNLAEGVLGVVSKKLRNSKNPLETFDEYVVTNTELLEEAPYVRQRLDNLRHDTLVAGHKNLMDIDTRIGKIETKLDKHTEMTKSGLKHAMLTATPESAGKLLEDLYNGVVQRRPGRGANDDRVNLPLTSPELSTIASQVEEVYMNMLTSKFTTSYADDSVKMNHDGLSKFLSENEEVVSMFVGDRGLSELKDLTFLHNFDGKELKNMGKLELNTFKKLLDMGGTNLGTMISNYKQISVGRLSRAYVAATSFQNMVKKGFEISDLSTFKATGFDWDMYERALTKTGHEMELSPYLIAKDGLILVMKGLATRGANAVKDTANKSAVQVTRVGISSERLFGENETSPQELERRRKALQKYLNTSKAKKVFGETSVEDFLNDKYSLNDDEYKAAIRAATNGYREDAKVTSDDLMGKEVTRPLTRKEIEEFNNPKEVLPEEASVLEERQPNTTDEALVADGAAELLGFRKEQDRLKTDPITRSGEFNPKTGELKWLS